jgi:hypothetical protein
MHSNLSRILLLSASIGALHAQEAATPVASPDSADQGLVMLDSLHVTARLDRARESLVPGLGASSFAISREQIDTQAQGADAPLSQVLLRMPGMAGDSYGQLHLRAEHANLQYKINEVLLPEGLAGFGQELDTRMVESVNLLTGSLPAQYGFRTAGVVDLHTRGAAESGHGSLSFYGGEGGAFRGALQQGFAAGPVDAFVLGSAGVSDLGLENPQPTREALHDHSSQERFFGNFSGLVGKDSRVSLLLGASAAKFEIPNLPGLEAAYSVDGGQGFDSSHLDERQRENNHFVVLSVQHEGVDGGWQASAFARGSGLDFRADPLGDLVFNGVASDVRRRVLSTGVEFDASLHLGETHTLRGGWLLSADRARADSDNRVLRVREDGSLSSQPVLITERSLRHGAMEGLYLQDEWQLGRGFTLNYGARADQARTALNEGQLSPRLNLVWTATEGAALHVGYARYFTPPPLELLSSSALADFAGTTNAPEVLANSPVRSERAHYFDAGLTLHPAEHFSLSLDTYAKFARNQLDEGQFGQALIFAPFNYARGIIRGAEFSASYVRGGLSAYANVAVAKGTGRGVASGEFQFVADELEYLKDHYAALDHDQRVTASAGVAWRRGRNMAYADLLFGTGLRSGFANTESLPSHAVLNLGGERSLVKSARGELRLRVDLLNAFDRSYVLRDGSGIGVAAPQYGARRSLYAGVTWAW